LGTVSSIDGKEITIAGGSTDLVTDKSYTRGFLEINNTKIGVQFYDKVTQTGMDPKILILVRQAPADWISKTVTLVPGCTKELDGLSGCRLGYLNEEQFGGSGHAIPAYHPVMENPQ
jgi:hypothetical protein